MTGIENEPRSLPTMEDLCLNAPLYSSYPVDKTNEEELCGIRYYDGHIDCYCVGCNKQSVFHSQIDYGYTKRTKIASDSNHFFESIFGCSRNDEHMLIFYFLIHDSTITKIGQHPSLADLATVGLGKYRKVLGNNIYTEFSKAVGLASHGIGIGAFVYLRRIFERLIEEAHTKEKDSNEWDETLYENERMAKKILLLKNALPEFLVENATLYSILSKGIHELSEEECQEAFPTTKLGIELILDEKLTELQRNHKIKDASGDINKLYGKMKDSS